MRIWRNILRMLVVIAICWCAITQRAQAQTGNDQRPGSVLFYTIYTSTSTNTAASDTLISITNTSPDTDIDVHLYFVDSFTCQVADALLALTRNQTARFLAGDIDPDVRGYIIAVAVDAQGLPAQHNFLVGSLFIKQQLGAVAGTTHSANLSAIAFAKMNNLTPPLLADGVTAELVFDGGTSASSYEPLPADVALDNIESTATADTRLNIFSPKSNLYGPGDFGGRLFIIYYDDAENAFSALVGMVCWLQARLTIIRNITLHIGAGSTGWARIAGYRNDARIPLLGSVIRAAEFSGGHNLHHLSSFPSYTITVPVFPPR
jgi:hypothetical protein